MPSEYELGPDEDYFIKSLLTWETLLDWANNATVKTTAIPHRGLSIRIILFSLLISTLLVTTAAIVLCIFYYYRRKGKFPTFNWKRKSSPRTPQKDTSTCCTTEPTQSLPNQSSESKDDKQQLHNKNKDSIKTKTKTKKQSAEPFGSPMMGGSVEPTTPQQETGKTSSTSPLTAKGSKKNSPATTPRAVIRTSPKERYSANNANNTLSSIQQKTEHSENQIARTQKSVRPLSASYIEPDQFVHKGTLKIMKYVEPSYHHALANKSLSQQVPNAKVTWQSKHEVVDIGTGVEEVVSNTKTPPSQISKSCEHACAEDYPPRPQQRQQEPPSSEFMARELAAPPKSKSKQKR